MNCSFTDEKESVDTTRVEKGETRLYDDYPAVREVVDIGSRFAGGNGTENDPYQISNVSQLQDMNLDLRANYTLVNDIDASETKHWNDGEGFITIANDYTRISYIFSGSLNGNRYNITNLYINRSSDNCIGLFGLIRNHGHISNVTLIDYKINGWDIVGGMVGLNLGIVDNCTLIGNVSGYSSIGGIVGENIGGTVRNCNVKGNVSGSWYTGGLVGSNRGTVSSCNAKCIVSGSTYVGGLVGLNDDMVKNCWVQGSVSGSPFVGGLVGLNDGMVQNCWATSCVHGSSNIGGLVGKNYQDFANRVSNSFYCINYTEVNNKKYITPHGIYGEQFEDWMDNGKSLDIDDYLSKIPGTNNYKISNVSDMKKMLPFADLSGYSFKQTADIDLSSDTGFYIPIFQGEYDGNGHTISYLETTYFQNDNVGMFGIVYKNGSIENVTFINGHIFGNLGIGLLVGFNQGTVLKCSTNGKASGNRVGGLVGHNDGTVLNCNSKSDVIGNHYIGGLVGFNNGKVESCDTTGNVSGGWTVGGLMGYNLVTVEECYSTGNVNGNYSIGGLVGENYGSLNNCYTTGNVTGLGDVGGLLGYNEDDGRVSNCYAIGFVNGDYSVGGFVGENTGGTVTNCYATGLVSGDVDVGGFVGDGWDGVVENCFYDMETVNISCNRGTGRTTIEMMTKSTFTDAGWDFDSIWTINEYIEPPHLQWEKRPIIKADDSDNDSYPDIVDDFPFDPSASIDTDNDGSPDEWNPEMNSTNSTTGLHLDAFPNDPAASIDSDGDGMPDSWNPGMDRNDSTSDPPLELDPFPHIKENTVPGGEDIDNTTDDSSNIWILVTLGTSVLVIILLLIVLIITRKRRSARKEEADEDKEDLGRVKPND